jgi:bifunctional non-homologous end joining protein LigD
LGRGSPSHPDKVLFPKQNLTKQDLVAYYEQIAPWMLVHVAGRPLSLVRCPAGKGRTCFFQRHAGAGNATAIREVKIAGKGDGKAFITIDNVEGLITLVQTGVLEVHVWGCRADRPAQPDRIVFDFDPHEDVPWAKIKGAAVEVRQRLKDLKLERVLKTTGGKGLHVVVPINRKPDWTTVKSFARATAQRRADVHPSCSRPMRARPSAPAAFLSIICATIRPPAPLHLIRPARVKARRSRCRSLGENLPPCRMRSFTIVSVLRRKDKLAADPWKDIENLRQSLPELPGK